MSRHADARRPRAAPAPERRWKVTATATATATPARPATYSLEQLRRALRAGTAVAGAERHALPFAGALAGLFDAPLPDVAVVSGEAVTRALDAADAEAANLGNVLFLRPDAALPVVAHELAHVLQRQNPAPAPRVDAEAEAARAERLAASAQPVPPVQAGLAPQAPAHRARTATAPPASPPPPTPATAATPAAAPAAAPAPAPAAPVAAAPSTPAAPTALPALGAAAEPMLDTADNSAAIAAARSALDAATDADAVLAAFAAAPPSVKAQEAANLPARIAAVGAAVHSDMAATPPLSARMSPGAPLPPAPALATPARAAALEATPPAATPLPQLAPTPAATPARANADAPRRLAQEIAAGDAAALQRGLAQMETRDAAVQTSAGARPSVPRTGASDPARIASQQQAAAAQGAQAETNAMQAVLAGPGPEQAQLHEVSEPHAVVLAPATAAAAPAAQAPAGFARLPLDTQTVALFDAAHAPAMQASLVAANSRLATASTSGRAAQTRETAAAHSEEARLNRTADLAQRAEVVARRADIQQARRSALAAQADARARTEAEAATARADAERQTEAEFQQADARIETEFTAAETDAQARVAAGARAAGAVRDRARREAEDASWWDRAVNWVKAQLEKLTQAINAIFDAVRAAVRDLIERAKTAALRLIEAAARLVTGLIEAVGRRLHALVNALLAEHFPAIAAALNAAIDTLVEAATAAVTAIAATLKAAVELLAAALSAALDAILATWQAGVNAALTLAAAALDGDWGALARLVLTPILLALGIDPDSFFQLFARAEQALDAIIANPSGFVANLIAAVTGGIRRFADNFGHHFVGGIILWLTGPLGRGIRMPAEFDLFGLLDVARQAVGLTLETLRQVAIRVIGEGAVAKIEFVLRQVAALTSGGWAGLWQQLSADLGALRDMVLAQIQEFLLQKVVLASIMWLAGLFNPVGALVKLVLTIWNFIQFLRAQLARIFAVVQTVVNSLWQIATGALEPPIRGVEQVLAGLLPVVLDLLARLIGVTGVPAKVQDVLGQVRRRIEAAAERLMRRLLALFGVDGRPAAAEAGAIMAPIQFAAGGESHTLSIADEGAAVRPMIRSAPTPLADWLEARTGAPFTALAGRRGWDAGTRAARLGELQQLVAAARTEEAALDTRAEAAGQALHAGAGADRADTAAKVAATASAGQQTKSAVMQVLEFFGIAVVPLTEKFAAELAAMPIAALRANLAGAVLPRLDVARYTPLDWAGLAAMLPGDGAATAAWRHPASALGAARRFTAGAFEQAIIAKAEALAAAPELAGTPQFLHQGRQLDDARVGELFANHLTRRLGAGPHRLAIVRSLLLGGRFDTLADDLQAPILAAVQALCGASASGAHDFAFGAITGSYFHGLQAEQQFAAAIANPAWGQYFHADRDNDAGHGAGVAKRLDFFLHADTGGQSGSRRAGRNGARLADAVRGANLGQHEWIAARHAAAILHNAAAAAASGNLAPTRGLFRLIRFQHLVRTPTRKLIFKPGGAYPSSPVVIRYQAHGHLQDSAWRGIAGAQLPPAQQALWYAPGHLAHGASVQILQGHPGAIYARVAGGAPVATVHQQVAGHHSWDAALAARVSDRLGDGLTSTAEIDDMADRILEFFNATIWKGGALPAGNALYDGYFAAVGAAAPVAAAALEADFTGYFASFAADLAGQIAAVKAGA